MITVVTQISYQAVGKQTSHVSTMISILFTILLCLFSVHVTECTEIQKDTTYTYNYENFGDIFHLGYTDGFNIYNYTDIGTGYEGPHIAGAFHMEGDSWTSTNWFDGYIVDISTTQYCGGLPSDIGVYVYYSNGKYDAEPSICGDNWFYNHSWIPPKRFSHLTEVSIHFMSVEECTSTRIILERIARY